MPKHTTCEKCPFKTMGFEECPNYIETMWYEKDEPQPQVVKDCAPKRTLLMVQELYNRCFGMQQQISQAEGQIVECRANVNKLIEALTYMEQQRKYELSAKKKFLDHVSSMKISNQQVPDDSSI